MSDGANTGGGLTLREAQERVDAWISQFEEVGELAREMNHRFGHKPKKDGEPEQDLAVELADILFVLIAIANEQGIDLDDALGRVLEKYRVRDAERWTPLGGGDGG